MLNSQTLSAFGQEIARTTAFDLELLKHSAAPAEVAKQVLDVPPALVHAGLGAAGILAAKNVYDKYRLGAEVARQQRAAQRGY